MNGKWTKIEDGLPDVWAIVLVCMSTEDGHPIMSVAAWLDGGTWISIDRMEGIHERVTHWMPLPDLPEEYKL